jgi:hypothetical protein
MNGRSKRQRRETQRGQGACSVNGAAECQKRQPDGVCRRAARSGDRQSYKESWRPCMGSSASACAERGIFLGRPRSAVAEQHHSTRRSGGRIWGAVELVQRTKPVTMEPVRGRDSGGRSSDHGHGRSRAGGGSGGGRRSSSGKAAAAAAYTDHHALRQLPTSSAAGGSHHTSCHRCNNARKNSLLCERCPRCYCPTCAQKVRFVVALPPVADGVDRILSRRLLAA